MPATFCGTADRLRRAGQDGAGHRLIEQALDIEADGIDELTATFLQNPRGEVRCFGSVLLPVLPPIASATGSVADLLLAVTHYRLGWLGRSAIGFPTAAALDITAVAICQALRHARQ